MSSRPSTRRPHGVGKRRAEHIRRDREAYWSTGRFDPPNYIPPDPPIREAERQSLQEFLPRFEQVYSCILPGEIVRECVDQIRAGIVAPLELVPIEELIVDEYQDLNPIDLEFIDSMAHGGAVTFVAGDDDQSIYSFRFALPRGIQTFTERYPGSGNHSLSMCFRCTTSVLAAAVTLITQYPSANRIPKQLVSAYAESDPPVEGQVMRWRFQNGLQEARGIASSCQALIAEGVKADQILILLSDRNILEGPITNALREANVPYESRNELDHLDSDEGRILYDLLRIISNPDDYIAHRSLLGLLRGVGVGTCVGIKDKVVANALNYRSIFYQPLPNGVFSPREANAIDRLSEICRAIADWEENDTLADRAAELADIAEHFGPEFRIAFEEVSASLPAALTLGELRQVLATNSEELSESLIAAACERMGEERPAQQEASKVRVMTMHGAKGLSARVVFVPGLEEEVFPGPRRRPYPGLIEEASRLLYVSITRARAACILSYARGRIVHGRFAPHAASRFNRATGGAFVTQEGGINPELARDIVADCALL